MKWKLYLTMFRELFSEIKNILYLLNAHYDYINTNFIYLSVGLKNLILIYRILEAINYFHSLVWLYRYGDTFYLDNLLWQSFESCYVLVFFFSVCFYCLIIFFLVIQALCLLTMFCLSHLNNSKQYSGQTGCTSINWKLNFEGL